LDLREVRKKVCLVDIRQLPELRRQDCHNQRNGEKMKTTNGGDLYFMPHADAGAIRETQELVARGEYAKPFGRGEDDPGMCNTEGMVIDGIASLFAGLLLFGVVMAIAAPIVMIVFAILYR
jgi:hypothetical protein